MSSDTYLSIILGSFFVLIITILLAIVDAKNTKDGRRKKKIFWGIIVGVIICSTIVTVFFLWSQVKQRESICLTLINDADYSVKSRNYLEAAKSYRQASDLSRNSDITAHALQREASCYMIYGISEKDKAYLQQALIIYENLIKDSEYENTRGAQESVIDLCSLYGILGYNRQDERWRSVIEKAENMFCFDDLENIPAEDIPNLIPAAVGMSYYYKSILLQDGEEVLLDGTEYGEKANYYLNAAIQLGDIYNNYIGTDIYDGVYLHLIYELSFNILNTAVFNPGDDSVILIEKARTLCQNAIQRLDMDNGNPLDLDIYLKLKQTVGKSYIFNSYFVLPPEAEELRHKAYQELISLFRWNDDELCDTLVTIANYTLLTRVCSEDDIQMILNRFSSSLKLLIARNSIAQQINTELAGLTMCTAILDMYAYESCKIKAQDLGQQLYTDLTTSLFDLLDNNEKVTLSEFADRFG